MEYNKEYIKDLLFEKIAGTISEQDNLVAEEAILHDAEVREFWIALKTKMDTPDGSTFLSGLDPDQAWKNTAIHLTEKTGSVFSRYKWAMSGVAAMLIIALPLAWYFSFTIQSPASMSKETIKQVYLKTDAGESIDLSSRGAVTLGQVRINAKDKELTYAAIDARGKEWATLIVPATKDYKIELSDGTIVWLNAASSLRFPFQFGKETREVYLSGEAYFKVAKNKQQEFIVHTSFADVHVHGTSFNVNAYNAKNFATALVEGAVSAKKNGQFIRLKPGEAAAMVKDNLEVRTFDAQEVLSWKDGTYFFHNQPLSEISEVLTRWFDVRVMWHSPEAADQTFTGEIDKNLPLEVVISNLRLSSGMQAELKKGILTFR